jgi:hypothetical protein
MTTPTLTCDTCESEIDVAKDPRCVVYDPSGSTDVICEACREACERAANAEWGSFTSSDLPFGMQHRIKRGWRA